MGWGTSDVFVAALDDQQMAILNSADEFHAFATLAFVDGFSEVFIEIVNQYTGIIRLKIATVMGDNLAVLQSDDITANGEVIIRHFVTYTCSL